MSRRLVVVALAMLSLACRETAPAPFPQTLENLVLEQRYATAMPQIRARLLKYPLDTGAHFYLGRCYQLMKPPWYAGALGEFETALHLYNDKHQPNTIERFTDDYFVFIAHLERAKVFTWLAVDYVDNGMIVPKAERDRLLKGFDESVAAAREALPDSPEIDTFINELRPVIQRLPVNP